MPNGYVGYFIARLLEARRHNPCMVGTLPCHGLLIFLYQTPMDLGMTSSYKYINKFIGEYSIPVVVQQIYLVSLNNHPRVCWGERNVAPFIPYYNLNPVRSLS